MGSEIYAGEALRVTVSDNVAELKFDRADSPVNTFDALALREFGQATQALAKCSLEGVIVTSTKEAFIVGADIVEFGRKFEQSEDAIFDWLQSSQQIFNAFEGLPFPSVVAINGYALGGGFEMCLSADFRVMSDRAQIGFPEINLGLIPGFGGTVRLPRITGVKHALQWITSAKPHKTKSAFDCGAIDKACTPEELISTSRELLKECIDGKLDYQQRRLKKLMPVDSSLRINETDLNKIKEQLDKKLGPNYPAAYRAIDAITTSTELSRDKALKIEATHFAWLAKSDQSKALTGNFVSDKLLARKARHWANRAKPVSRAGVIGAGIMGGGICFQSALTGTPVLMKDINQAGIDLGMQEAQTLLDKRIQRGRLTEDDARKIMHLIQPTLDYSEIDQTDIVVEAVIENIKIKQSVLKEVESLVSPDTVLTSNTSTISIDLLASSLERPEHFCGMHFFNPVHAMLLVEVIRGAKTNDETIAKTVAYALSLGKKPVVVNDCPGFLVNRILFPYFAGFYGLLQDGANFETIDKAMEQWGMPMGPAYLIDVVGIDTVVHCEQVLADAFPDRMLPDYTYASKYMHNADRFGQKNNKGFYEYANGKETSQEAHQLLKNNIVKQDNFSPEEIVVRMLLPMATELARCLEEGIVESPAEADMALIYGIGFPRFRGGIFRWLDTLESQELLTTAERYGELGPLYQLTEQMRERAESGRRYYEA